MSRNLRLEVILQAVDKATGPLRQAMKSSGALAKQLKDTKDQLKALDRQQQTLEKFKETSRGLAVTKHQLQGAADKLRKLKEGLAQTAQPTKKLTEAIRVQQTETDKLRLRHGKLYTQDIKLRESLQAAGLGTTQLTAQQRQLKGAAAELNQVLDQQKHRLERVNQSQQKLIAARKRYDRTQATRDKLAGAGAALGATGAAVGAPVMLSVRAYAQAEDAATALRGALMLKDGRIAPEFERINALAEQLGNRLPGTTSELQGMMTMLLRQGMSSQAILSGLGEATAYIGVQMKMPYEDAARFSAQLQDATRTTEQDMMGLMDVIQKTYYTGVDPDWMLQGFSKLGAGMDIIRQKGLAGAQTLAPLLAMANQAGMTDGGSAGNAYRKVFQLALDAKKVGKANAQLSGTGIQLDFTNGQGEFGGLEQLFTQLAKLRQLSTQTRISALREIYGDDAETLQVLTLLIDKGQAGYNAMQAKLEAQASLQQRVGQQLGTLKNLWDAASGTFTNFLVKLGEAIAPEVKALTIWLGEMAERAGAWAKQNPQLAATLMKVLAVISMTTLALGGLALAVAAVLGPLALAKLSLAILGIKGAGLFATLWTLAKTALPAVAQGVLFIGRALLMTPIGLAVTGIALAALAIWKYWGPIKGFFAGLWQGVLAKTNQALVWFLALPSRFSTLGTQLMQGLVSGIHAGLANVKSAITGAGTATINWFKEKLGIHSPSRVFAELGGYTMDGLAVGLNKGQSSPLAAVAATARRLSAAGATLALSAGTAMAGSFSMDSRPPLAAPGMSHAAMPVSITNHITITAAPGMDERMLARLVASEIDKAERQRAARSRSRLGDRD